MSCVSRTSTTVASEPCVSVFYQDRSLKDCLRLDAAWHEALSSALSYFRALLSSANSSSWKPVSVLPLTASTTARDSGDSRGRDSALGQVHANDVAVHRRSGKNGEVYRATVEVECGSDVSVDTFRGCLATPETRPLCELLITSEAVLKSCRGSYSRIGDDDGLAGRAHPSDQNKLSARMAVKVSLITGAVRRAVLYVWDTR